MKKYMSVLMAAIVLTSMAGCSGRGSDLPLTEVVDVDDGSSATTAPDAEKTNVGKDIVDDGEGGTTRIDISAEKEYSAADEDGGIFDFFGFADAADEAVEFSADYAVAESPTAAAAGGAMDSIGGCVVDADEWIEPEVIQPQAGLLTGGEWNDNDNWHDWVSLYQTHEDWNEYRELWRVEFDGRIAVKVTTDDGTPVEGAAVLSEEFAAVTDNKGMAYIFFDDENAPESVTVSYKDIEKVLDTSVDTELECTLGNLALSSEKFLDLLLMVDTTGSMSDELMYLQTELRDVVERVSAENANLPIRLSVNFYRDVGDEYIVREYPFTFNLDDSVDFIMAQDANGGGDTPEAVHTALDSAIKGHDWDDSAVKLMFLVLDAPPHADEQIIDEVNSLTALAAEQGIRIIPVASSGVDKATEYLLRTMAFTTGGTYTFLTDHSGIGNSHIEPTIGNYEVEKLNDMMVRIIGGYLE